MYNYYDYSIQDKKTLQPQRVNQEIFQSRARLVWLGQENWVKYIEIEASSEFLVSRGRHTFKNENRKLGVSRVGCSSIFQPSDIRGLQ